MEKEIWKPLTVNNVYQISNLGNIKSLSRKHQLNDKLLKPNKQEYLSVSISKDGKSKRFKIHRLIAIEFIPNPENKPIVNHIDGNKYNNAIYNLEWCTHAENCNHAIETGLVNYNDKKKPNNSKKVICIDDNTIFNTVEEAKKHVNLHRNTFDHRIKKGLKINNKTYKYYE